MPAVPPFPIKGLLSQFNKREYTQNQGEDDSDVKSPVALVGLLIAALTLLVATIPILRCPRFRRWVSSSIPSSAKRALGVTLPNSPPGAVISGEDSSAIPATEIPIPPSPALIYNNFSNTYSANLAPIPSPTARTASQEKMAERHTWGDHWDREDLNRYSPRGLCEGRKNFRS
ncbi:unnamed protein product [Tuber aestivum]|uniref:Uncharacterized protein n=1 Tax=Tuber aestivum TaxID=59557 RepID=A0A292Q3B9_9PEZI|nr:unnamed protein product [Tuber aestivum]